MNPPVLKDWVQKYQIGGEIVATDKNYSFLQLFRMPGPPGPAVYMEQWSWAIALMNK